MGICYQQNRKKSGIDYKSLPKEAPIMIKVELGMGHKQVPVKAVNKLSKSICKITFINNEDQKVYGTGFFMIYKASKCLISVYHVINENRINKTIEIEIFNNEKFNLELKSPFIKFFKQKDISIVEIKDSDGIKDIEYLNYDKNYIDGYSQYKGMEVLSLGYPFGKDLTNGSGEIININGYEFEHNISTEQGSSGSPIILFNVLKVIGIHKYGDLEKRVNVGIFIGEIFDEIKNDLKKVNNEKKNIGVKEDDERNIERIDKNNILDLSHQNLGNEGIQKITLINYNIAELNLNSNNISDIKVLEKVKFNKLEKLNLESNKISNINILENVDFKKLKELNLNSNNISDIKVLEKVKFNKLEKLDLGFNKISNNINILENVDFKELKELNLFYNNISDIKVLEKVKFNKLEILNLGINIISNNIKILENVNFKELKELNISKNNISDIKVLENVKFNKLEKLYLESNKISNINILENFDFKELKDLYLSDNNISDIKVLEKVKFNKLEKLNLGWNKISDINILENVDFKELKELYLHNNNISDIKVLEKVKFNKLEILDLRANEISDISSIISELKLKDNIYY